MYSDVAITRTLSFLKGGWVTIINGLKPHKTHKEFCSFNPDSQVQCPKHCGEKKRIWKIWNSSRSSGVRRPEVETNYSDTMWSAPLQRQPRVTNRVSVFVREMDARTPAPRQACLVFDRLCDTDSLLGKDTSLYGFISSLKFIRP